MDKASQFREYIRQSSANYNETADLCADQVSIACDVIASVFSKGNRLLLAGNGVDASICETMASRFTSRLSYKAPRLGWPAMSLTTNTAFLTGHSSQFGNDEVYSRLVQALGARNDILMVFESGDSQENIAWALRKAQNLGLHTIAVSSFTNKLTKMADVGIKIPLKDQPRVAEVAFAIQNAICLMVEQELLK